jgi:hypothetical protein
MPSDLEKQILKDVLVLLAGQRFPTPEKGFTCWQDAYSSLQRFIREHVTPPTTPVDHATAIQVVEGMLNKDGDAFNYRESDESIDDWRVRVTTVTKVIAALRAAQPQAVDLTRNYVQEGRQLHAAPAPAPAPVGATELHWPFTARHENCAECSKEYEPPPALSGTTCVCGHLKSQHSWHQDHDECEGCRGLDEPCSEFVAAPTEATDSIEGVV